MQKPLTNPSTISYEWLKRNRIARVLEIVQDLFVISLWLPPTFKGIDPEKRLLMRNKVLSTDNSSNAIETAANLNSQPVTSIFANETNGSVHQD